MSVAKKKIRLAVVSPFLDKSHGTERIAVEWIAQIAGEFDVHIYSQHVEDLDLSNRHLASHSEASRPAHREFPVVVRREPCCGARGIGARRISITISSTAPE